MKIESNIMKNTHAMTNSPGESSIILLFLNLLHSDLDPKINSGKISAQPHTSLCIQFLNRENNDKNNTLPLGKQICFTIVWGCAEILPKQFQNSVLEFYKALPFSSNLLQIVCSNARLEMCNLNAI